MHYTDTNIITIKLLPIRAEEGEVMGGKDKPGQRRKSAAQLNAACGLI